MTGAPLNWTVEYDLDLIVNSKIIEAFISKVKIDNEEFISLYAKISLQLDIR